MKAEGRLGRCYLKGRAGDAANVILSAVGYNLRLVLAWLRMILRVVLLALLQAFAIRLYKPGFLTGDCIRSWTCRITAASLSTTLN